MLDDEEQLRPPFLVPRLRLGQALPSSLWLDDTAAPQCARGGRAALAVRSQAEPGNELTPALCPALVPRLRLGTTLPSSLRLDNTAAPRCARVGRAAIAVRSQAEPGNELNELTGR